MPFMLGLIPRMYQAQAGDVLLYRKAHNLTTDAITLLQRLEDGGQPFEYYHAAIALDAARKIESNGKTVLISPLDYGRFDAFRPPISSEDCDKALRYIQGLVGQPYDWWVVVDDVLRYLTHDILHLPVGLIQSEERRKKICSSLVAKYFSESDWTANLGPNASPEDIYLVVRKYAVGG